MTKFEQSLKKYLDIFHGQEGYFTSDLRNLEYFKANPDNTKEDEIRSKISSVSDPDLTNHDATEPMIDHILKLNIDARLANGDLRLVDDIANLTIEGKPHNFLRFASMYCNLHRPNIYPIYSDQHFDFYRQYIKIFDIKIDPEKLNTYPVFCAALEDLLKRLGMVGKMDYLHIRKFGWMYIDKVVSESRN